MVAVPIRIVGQDRLAATIELSLAGTKPEARTRLAKNLGVLALREHGDYFATNRTPAGQPWRPLSPVTIARRRDKRKSTRGQASFTGQILRDTGKLRLSVTPGRTGSGQPDPDNRYVVPGFESSADGSVRIASANGFTVGSALNYASAHQYGLKKRTGRVGAYRVGGPFTVKAHNRKGGMVSGFTRKDGVKVKSYYRRYYNVQEYERIGGSVRAHTRRLPAVPERPFVGFSQRFIDRAMHYILSVFIPGR